MSTATIELDVEYTAEIPEAVGGEEFLSEDEFEEEIIKELGLDLDDVMSYSITTNIQYPEWYDG